MDNLTERNSIKKLLQCGYSIRRFDDLRYDYEILMDSLHNNEMPIIIEYHQSGKILRKTAFMNIDGAVETFLRFTNRQEAAESDFIVEENKDGMKITGYIPQT